MSTIRAELAKVGHVAVMPWTAEGRSAARRSREGLRRADPLQHSVTQSLGHAHTIPDRGSCKWSIHLPNEHLGSLEE